ncbi:MAG: proprotein convertase P-domain-containing protein [Saprospiraceae bacterium]|nr:proprotein convertase P-domain-containing protein [Saprospiraceae bacterium]
MKKIFYVLSLTLLTFSLQAQSLDPRIAPTQLPLGMVGLENMPPLDNQQLLEAELARRAPGIAPKFAHTFEVNITPQTHGLWEHLSNGRSVWRLNIRSENALSLNFGFSDFWLPPNSTFVMYDPTQKHIMGPFHPADNELHGQFWTPIFEQDEVVLEFQMPSEYVNRFQLTLSAVNHDFLGFSQIASGSCNLDVICGAEDGFAIVDLYRDIIQSVAVYGLNGNTFCTGFLINNVENDCTPYFMTANHCNVNDGNAPSLVVYWNFQNSVCRQPNSPESGAPGDGQLIDFNSGAIHRASYAPSDMTLVELDDPVSETANAFFAGWDVNNVAPKDTIIGIHHPSTDEKRISFEFDPSYVGQWGSGADPVPNGTHIIIPDWDIGTTEPGSSGSPIFDNQKRVIGQLHGGAAACGNNAYDSYGWMAISWEGGGAPSNRLRDWLDPESTGITQLDGRFQSACDLSVTPTLSTLAICAPDTAIFNLQISENFIDSVLLTVSNLPQGTQASLSDTLVAPGTNANFLVFDTDFAQSGTYEITISGTDGENNTSSIIELTIAAGIPEISTLIQPVNEAVNQSLAPTFEWDQQAGGVVYHLQLATDEDFTNIIFEDNAINTSDLTAIALDAETTYFWRVKGQNICGEADWSTAYSFKTAAIFCNRQEYRGEAVEISSEDVNTVSATMEVNIPGFISEISISDLDISHTWVGDLSARLVSPSGTEILLFDRPGVPASNFGCDESDIFITLSDNAQNDADVLENTCNGGFEAIGGDFQPIDPFTTFIGEAASGTWTLIVDDAFAQDGGSINDWKLDICASYPQEAVVTALNNNIIACSQDTLFLDVLIGGGFNSDSLEISVDGLPMGAYFVIAPEQPQAASIVGLQMGDFGMPGIYNLSVVASDGTNTDQANITVEIAPSPQAVTLLNPANGATNVPLNGIFSWSTPEFADNIILLLSPSPDFDEAIISLNFTDATNTSIEDLETGNTYYWQIITVNDCGQATSEVSSFTTFPDLSFESNIDAISACELDTAGFNLSIGADFESPLSISHQLTPDVPGLAINYDIDPDDVPSGASINASIPSLPAGNYELEFTLDDGANTASIMISLDIAPLPTEQPTLVMPLDEEVFFDIIPEFSWSEVPEATNYLLEVSFTPDFSDLFLSESTTATNFSLAELPELGTYYWRVTAFNNCGTSVETPAIRTFEVDIFDSVQEIQGTSFWLSPNPTPDQVGLYFGSALRQNVEVQVYNVLGQLLLQTQLPAGQTELILDLSNYSSGSYLIQLRSGEQICSKKVLKQGSK